MVFEGQAHLPTAFHWVRQSLVGIKRIYPPPGVEPV